MADENHTDSDTLTASEGATNVDYATTETFYATDSDGGVNDSRSARTASDTVTVTDTELLYDGVSELYVHPLYSLLVSSSRTRTTTLDPLATRVRDRAPSVPGDIVPM